MKKTKRTLAIILCLVLILSSAVLADWVQYQKDGDHNGRITDAAPYIANGGTLSTGAHMGTIQLGSGGWSGIDSESLMLTENGTTYAYVTYNGGTVTGDNGGTRLAKINVTTMNGTAVNPTKVWDIQLTQTANFQLSTPCYYDGKIYVAGSGLSQLLQNNELVKTNGSYDHWTITGGSSQNNGSVTITNNGSATFVSDYIDITNGYTHRPAMGIYLGATAPSSAKATIEVYAIPSGGTEIDLGTYIFSPTASNASNRPIQDLNTLDYYYYLNHNLTTAYNSSLISGSYQIKYIVTMSSNSGNSVNVEYCSFYEQNSSVFEVSDLTNTTAPTTAVITTIGTNGGQLNTPITGYSYSVNNDIHKCIYFGTYSGTHYYYQFDLGTKQLKTFVPTNSTTGFYWAGAYSDGTSVAFGGDNGYLYYTTAEHFGETSYKVEYNLSQSSLTGITDAGNIRSSLCKYGNYVYFTSQGDTGINSSYLWRIYWPNIANLSSSDISVIKLSGGSSTSTPVISSNNYIYVGTYGQSDYSKNGVRAIDLNNFDANHMYDIVSGSGSGSSGTNCVVQSSVIVYSPDTTVDYVFYTTNQSGGRGYCVKHTISGHAVSNQWNTGSGNFTLQGMSEANGYLTFGNDGHTFYVIKP